MTDRIKFTVLGSGTCVPNGERNSSGYFLETSTLKMMLDCGAGTVHALSRYNLPWQEMTHLFISHFHIDHIGELPSLMQAFRYGMKEKRSTPLELIGPPGFVKALDAMKTAFGERLLKVSFPLSIREVNPGDSIDLSDSSRMCFEKTPHTSESLCVRLELDGKVLGYTGDTDADVSLASFFSRADLLVSECSFQKRREGVPHLAIEDAARLASDSKVKRLMVSHFYFDPSECDLVGELSRYYDGELLVAHDGLTLEM